MRTHLAIALPVVMAGFGILSTGPTASAVPFPACTCMSPKRPPCEVWWQTPAIFVGEVEQIEGIDVETGEGTTQARIVTLKVQEVFKGVDDDEVEVRTGAGGGDCGFDFEEGRLYLVYANRSRTSGRLETGICSRTAALEDAVYDLSYLRGIDDMEEVVSLYGMVYRERQEPETGGGPVDRLDPGGPLAGVDITVEGQGRELTITSDAEGWYEVDGLPPGRYELFVHVEGVDLEERWRVRVPVAPACLWRNLIVPALPREQ